jgi:3-oxoadipate enol-lactonase
MFGIRTKVRYSNETIVNSEEHVNPHVVLLTPIGLDAGTWDAVELTAQPIKHEYPGHGARPRAGALDLAGLADEVADSYAGDLDVVGVSLGAMVGMHLALRHPDRVRSLLLACSGAAADRETMLRRADDAEALGMEGVLDETLRRWFTSEALAQSDHAGVGYARATLLALDPATFAAAWRAIADHDVRDRLEAIQGRTTVVGGSADAAAPPERIAELAAAIPEARSAIVDGPHMLQLERPGDFGRCVADHLALVEVG